MGGLFRKGFLKKLYARLLKVVSSCWHSLRVPGETLAVSSVSIPLY